jgi:hypothetical protein
MLANTAITVRRESSRGGSGRAIGGPVRGAGAAGNQKPQLVQRAPDVRTSAPHCGHKSAIAAGMTMDVSLAGP